MKVSLFKASEAPVSRRTAWPDWSNSAKKSRSQPSQASDHLHNSNRSKNSNLRNSRLRTAQACSITPTVTWSMVCRVACCSTTRKSWRDRRTRPPSSRWLRCLVGSDSATTRTGSAAYSPPITSVGMAKSGARTPSTALQACSMTAMRRLSRHRASSTAASKCPPTPEVSSPRPATPAPCTDPQTSPRTIPSSNILTESSASASAP